jgi:GAF domain-containing protein
MKLVRNESESLLGWKDSNRWLIAAVFGMAIAHELADVALVSYLGPFWTSFVGVAATSLVAICFGLTLLNAHRADRRKLDKTICERDSLHEQSIEILAKLNTSLVQVENYNRQLRLIGDFAMQIQECETEQKIFETVENLFPAMFVTDGGSLYCPTPEATLERTVRWPKLGTSGRVIHPRRCPAVRNTCRIQGEFAACESCRLADPRKVACIPLRTGRNITGLLQLSFPDSYSAYPRHSSQNSIIRMAADQLSLALSNVTSRKNLGDMVMRDGLTGAFNRRYMEEALQREIARSRRSKSPISLWGTLRVILYSRNWRGPWRTTSECVTLCVATEAKNS